ncbi:hypothetical protein VNO77_39454 [Canavalia gladiata]|uniref:Uncharacterized protein n=1 Tax=Canavalia gladiata TaxID=3824 RepID=A0AAN9PX52_CANGL
MTSQINFISLYISEQKFCTLATYSIIVMYTIFSIGMSFLFHQTGEQEYLEEKQHSITALHRKFLATNLQKVTITPP